MTGRNRVTFDDHGSASRGFFPALSRRKLLIGMTAAGAVASLGLPIRAFAGATGRLRIAGIANPSSLDPATSGSGSDHVYLFNFYDTLVDWDPDTLAPRPGLAKSYAFSDPQTLVLDLREGVTFHDGTPMDAEAVKFNLDRMRGSPLSNHKAEMSTIDTVEITGPLQVTLRLKVPDSAMPLILADRPGMVVSPTALKASEQGRIDRSPVGTGAWKYVSWTDAERLIGEANPAYWRQDRPGAAEIEFFIIPDAATRLRAVQSGQVDIAYLVSERFMPVVERNPKLTGITRPTAYIYQLYLNGSKGPLADVRVRQAINHAIDRNSFIQAVQQGLGEAAAMNLPKSHWAYAPEAEEYTRYDPDLARRLLAEAGHADGLQLDFRSYPDQAAVQRQEVILNQLSKVGIRGRFLNAPIAEADSRVFGGGEGDVYLSAWTGRADPTVTYVTLYDEKSYYNPGRVAPLPGFNEAIAESRATDDQAARATALAKVQKLAMQNALTAPISFRYETDAATKQVANFAPNLLGKPKFQDVTLLGNGG
ncbi:peptide ABC transporter [Haematobacter genomosp. 1]|uniref:Peptide ABC transporter n=1 Tax=Haematobacter genomosp. 1 TaxID=366618 RepID=A0A212A9G0_9RHOB|nr:peptide ABC transporter [Haematobacter genomosp. 1]